MSAYLKFYRQVRYDYEKRPDRFLCTASEDFNISWEIEIERNVIKSHAADYLMTVRNTDYRIGNQALFDSISTYGSKEQRTIRKNFLNWIIEKLDKERRQLKIQELEHYRETVHPESEECKMTNVQIKILYGDATSDDYYCSPDDEDFYLWEAAIFIEQWIKE